MTRPAALWSVWPSWAGTALLVVGSLACSSEKAESPEPPKKALCVTSEDKTNDGRPFWVLVRAVDDKSFLQESYATVASKVPDEDESVLAKAVVFPGVERALHYTPKEKIGVAAYFLLTEPETEWKYQLSAPATRITLSIDRIKSTQTGKNVSCNTKD